MRRLLLIVFFCTQCPGCAIHYYDANTSTQHVFGLSHIAMKVPADQGQTVYSQTRSYGVSGGSSRGGGHFSVGFFEETMLDLAEDSSYCFEWPDSTLFNIKVGSEPPNWLVGEC